MKPFFTDIFTYHHHFNQQLAGQLAAHADRLPDRTIPLFSHIINAHQIWNARILDEERAGVHDVHTIEKIRQLDENNFATTLQILDTTDLAQRITYRNSRGDAFDNSVQEILFHVANHSTHHKGQIISDLRQSGVAPIITDYIFYKR